LILWEGGKNYTTEKGSTSQSSLAFPTLRPSRSARRGLLWSLGGVPS